MRRHPTLMEKSTVLLSTLIANTLSGNFQTQVSSSGGIWTPVA